MDKFAVDLDQVLNDFEYSELTDQYNASRNQDTQTSTSSNHNNVTKHSINNVFHSLNEYLNTNINVADVSQVENVSRQPTHSLLPKPNSLKNNVSTKNDKDTFVSLPPENAEKCHSNKNEILLPNKNEIVIPKETEVLTIPNNLVDIENLSNETDKKTVELGSERGKEIYDGFKEEKINDENTKEGSHISSDDCIESNNLIEIPDESNIEGTQENESHLVEESNIASDEKTAEKKNTAEPYQVGFSDELNLDDSDINKLLAEFENELALHSDDIQDHVSDPNLSKNEELDVGDVQKESYPGVQEVLEVYKDKGAEQVQINYLEAHKVKVQGINDLEVDDNNHRVQQSDLKVPKGKFEAQRGDLEVYDNHEDQKNYLQVQKDENISMHEAPEETLNSSEDNAEDTKRGSKLQKERPELHEDCPKILPEEINFKENNLVCESDVKAHEDSPKIIEDVDICEDDAKDCGNDESQEVSKIDFREIIETEGPSFVQVDQDKEFEEDGDAKINIEKEATGEKQISPFRSTLSKSDITTNPEDSGENELVCPSTLNTELEVEEIEIKVNKNTGDNKSVLEECKIEDCKNESIIIGGGDTAVEQLQSVGEDKDENEQKSLQDSLDSACRPQNLPLKGTDGDSQREINLIGGPGSTPYNNVYVNEEIQKISAVDSDTDSSTSSTNTFSDASSIASTASTEEMKDDHEAEKNVISANVDDCALAIEKLKIGKEATGENSVAGLSLDEQSVEASKTENEPQENSETITESDENREMVENEQSEPAAEIDLGSASGEKQWLGKEAPLWIPDSDTTSCLHCDMKFTVLKRRHHCRACGLVLCSKCCSLRFKLEYLDAEARVCNKCHDILNKDSNSSSSSDLTPDSGNSPHHRPNPNNPLEYCSTISPLQQVGNTSTNPPAIMVPVGVLKRKGSNKGKSNKSVMFCDGIRPGSDLTNLDNDFNYNNTKTRKLEKNSTSAGKINRNLPIIDSETNTFIPKSENSLPPLVTVSKTDISYTDCSNSPNTVEMLKQSQHTFAVHLSLSVHVKIIDMNCCINKMAWCFCTEGMINVGQDEIVILLEYIDEESFVPKDVFYHINNVYTDAVKGTSIKEMGLSLHNSANFLDSKNHAGFVYIRPTFQCVENIIKPKDPYLIGILIHRWETPWAKLFPLRLILRLGAEYRYYPSPIISTRHRDSVFVEIGHTIINLLADFRNFSYTLPQIRGLTIHMEDKNTTVTIPVNRYDQVIKSLNNTSDHILAFAGVFSQQADSHLVCIQDTQGNDNCYSTHAINIHNKPRKVTGASFIVFNGALKSSSGLTAKSNIVEDGLMIQVMPEHMQQIRDKLRAMKDHTIHCGCVNADSDETVNIVWGENDVNFNVGVTSAIDGMSLSGIPSIRVHNGKNHICVNGNRIIRWTEVFIIQNGEDNPKNQDPVDISRLSESIAKATCDALVKYLDLLLTNNCQKLGIRVTLQEDNVSYFAGSNGTKLAPIYMKSLDDELIPVLHRIMSNDLRESAIVLELIFRILNV